MTISFWVKSSKTGTYCLSIQNIGNALSYIREYTINSTDTWEKKSITIPGSTSGTWDKTTGSGIILSWALAMGSTYQNSANSWVSGNYLATSNQVNLLDSISNSFYLSQVQLEVGDKATDFEFRDYGTELLRCQRYYQRFVGVSASQYLALGHTHSTVQASFLINFITQMRTSPSFSATNNGTYGFGTSHNGSNTVITSLSSGVISTLSAQVIGGTAGSLVAGRGIALQGNSSSDYLEFNAEL